MEIISTINAPKAIGPYSQAIRVGNFLYTSGVLAINLETGNIETTNIEEQAKLVLKYLEAILNSDGYSKESVIKTTIFLKDLNDFGKVNKVYEEFFSTHKPARSTVEVARLPKDALIEIEVVAVKE